MKIVLIIVGSLSLIRAAEAFPQKSESPKKEQKNSSEDEDADDCSDNFFFGKGWKDLKEQYELEQTYKEIQLDHLSIGQKLLVKSGMRFMIGSDKYDLTGAFVCCFYSDQYYTSSKITESNNPEDYTFRFTYKNHAVGYSDIKPDQTIKIKAIKETIFILPEGFTFFIDGVEWSVIDSMEVQMGAETLEIDNRGFIVKGDHSVKKVVLMETCDIIMVSDLPPFVNEGEVPPGEAVDKAHDDSSGSEYEEASDNIYVLDEGCRLEIDLGGLDLTETENDDCYEVVSNNFFVCYVEDYGRKTRKAPVEFLPPWKAVIKRKTPEEKLQELRKQKEYDELIEKSKEKIKIDSSIPIAESMERLRLQNIEDKEREKIEKEKTRQEKLKREQKEKNVEREQQE